MLRSYIIPPRTEIMSMCQKFPSKKVKEGITYFFILSGYRQTQHIISVESNNCQEYNLGVGYMSFRQIHHKNPHVENLVAVSKFAVMMLSLISQEKFLGYTSQASLGTAGKQRSSKIEWLLRRNVLGKTPKLSNITEKMNPCLHLMNIYQAPTRGHVQSALRS